MRRQTLEQLNDLSLPLLAKLEAPILSALAHSGVSMSEIAAVEIVGGGMRPRCVKSRVAQILKLASWEDHTTGYGLRYCTCCQYTCPTSHRTLLYVLLRARHCFHDGVCVCVVVDLTVLCVCVI